MQLYILKLPNPFEKKIRFRNLFVEKEKQRQFWNINSEKCSAPLLVMAHCFPSIVRHNEDGQLLSAGSSQRGSFGNFAVMFSLASDARQLSIFVMTRVQEASMVKARCIDIPHGLLATVNRILCSPSLSHLFLLYNLYERHNSQTVKP